MSGGVDSAVSAALLARDGHDVFGAFLHLWSEDGIPDARENACCSTEGLERARRVADALGIPLYALNVRDRFKEEVVDPWLERSFASETPNPCLTCNRRIKIGFLLERADALGCTHVATGHYAQVRFGADGTAELHRGADAAKDQSYMLARCTPEQLSRLLLPVGAMRKTEVREHARAFGMPDVATTKDSQQLSFIADDVPSFLARQGPDRLTPGTVRDVSGAVYRTAHRGLPLYTIGQRRGVPVSGTTEPRYVVGKDAASNTLIVGPKEALLQTRCTLHDLNVLAEIGDGTEIEVQVRSHAAPIPASAVRRGDEMEITLSRPERALVPGQEAVLYRGTRCLGTGRIRVAAQ